MSKIAAILKSIHVKHILIGAFIAGAIVGVNETETSLDTIFAGTDYQHWMMYISVILGWIRSWLVSAENKQNAA